jgi:3D (Asp-Asp-Asp) domain-containing protein
MEAKGFFSKSSNIFSVAILLAGLSTFGAGVYISETNAKDIQKQTIENEQRIELMENTLAKEREKYEKQIQQQQSQLHTLLQQNNELKKQVITYRNRSESPPRVRIQVKPQVKPVESSQKKVNVIATAYTSDCEGCSGVTSTGLDVRNTTKHNGKTIIATDPRVIPLHSIVRVDTESGQSFMAVVEDVGGAIKGGKIDVLVANNRIANQFGRQRATITVIKEGGNV